MSTVTQSAATSAVRLFGTITTTADAVSSAVNSIGTSFEVLNIKTNDWLLSTREMSQANAVDRSIAVRDTVAMSIANRVIERNKVLDKNPDLRTAYDQALAEVNAALAKS